MEKLGKRIAFLATGDEIVNGEIIDTNAPYFAQLLLDHSFVPGTRLTVSDDQNEMEAAIRYLLNDHEVVVTIGGLGPTSDDRTRFAVSDAIEQPLEFDEPSWQRIIEKLTALNVEIPENNKQQCLFPKNAEIYPNPNGTASACCIQKDSKLLFMLPGPPNECRLIFERHIIPRLKKANLQENVLRRSWMLLGVSEGKIAEQLDPLVEGKNCDIGYRVNHPYLEVKLRSSDENTLEIISSEIEERIKERLISRNKQTASELLYEYLTASNTSISIDDQATQGRLASLLLWPETSKKLNFNGLSYDINVTLNGLSEYWEDQDCQHAKMQLCISTKEKILLNQLVKVPIREKRTPAYAAELACELILKNLKVRLNSN